MTQLMKQRPWAVWCLFLAGAVTGGIASSLMEPQQVWADPANLNGRKFEDLQALVEAHDELLQGISRDPESGAIEFKDSKYRIELLGQAGLKIELLDPLDAAPALSVLGPARFESAVAPSCVVLNDQGSQHPDPVYAPAMQVEGRSVFTGDGGPDYPLVLIDPLMIRPTAPVMVIAAGDGALTSIDPARIELSHQAALTTVLPDRIELLHSAADGPVRFGVAEDGSYLDMGPGPGAFRVEGPAYATDFIDTDQVIDPF